MECFGKVLEFHGYVRSSPVYNYRPDFFRTCSSLPNLHTWLTSALLVVYNLAN